MEFCLCLDTHYLKSPTSNSPKGAVLMNIAVTIYREDGFCVIDKVMTHTHLLKYCQHLYEHHNLKNVHLVNCAYSKCFFLNIMSTNNKKYNFVINFTIQRKHIVFVCPWRKGGSVLDSIVNSPFLHTLLFQTCDLLYYIYIF